MSNSSSSSSTSSGIGCTGLTAVLLGVAFIVLKITGQITWSWFWVLAPFWIYIGLGIAVVLVIIVVFILGALGIGFAKGIGNAIKNRKLEKERESRRIAQARPLGTFDSLGNERPKKEYKTHQWML